MKRSNFIMTRDYTNIQLAIKNIEETVSAHNPHIPRDERNGILEILYIWYLDMGKDLNKNMEEDMNIGDI